MLHDSKLMSDDTLMDLSRISLEKQWSELRLAETSFREVDLDSFSVKTLETLMAIEIGRLEVMNSWRDANAIFVLGQLASSISKQIALRDGVCRTKRMGDEKSLRMSCDVGGIQKIGFRETRLSRGYIVALQVSRYAGLAECH